MDVDVALSTTEIQPRVLLTSAAGAWRTAWGKAGMVLVDLSNAPDVPTAVAVLRVGLVDEERRPATEKLVALEAVLGAARQLYEKNQTLVFHCIEGKNRSALAVARYLVRFEHLEPGAAVELIRRKRPGTLTNETFLAYVLANEVPS